MGSQSCSAVFAVVALAFGSACGNSQNPTISSISLPEDAPDLALRNVAFARLSEGRVVARGTADRLDYRRAGGRLSASGTGAVVYPEPGTSLSELGAIHFAAPRIEGEVPTRRGVASSGVKLDATRGDSARTEKVRLDGESLSSDTRVVARGPGYRVEGNGLLARTDGSLIQLTNGTSGQLQMEGRR